MPFPKDIRVIDCMMNIPTDEHNVAGYQSMATMQRDAPGKSTTMPAGYMFKNVPNIGSDPAKFVENMSNADIAAMMGKSEGAVKSLQHRALRSLARLMQADTRKNDHE